MKNCLNVASKGAFVEVTLEEAFVKVTTMEAFANFFMEVASV